MASSNPPPPLAVLRGHDDPVVSIKFLSPHILLSGGLNGILKMWNMHTLRATRTTIAHEKSIISIGALSKTEISTSSRDGTVKIWDVENSYQPCNVLRTGHDHFCNSSVLEISKGRSIIVSPGIKQSQILLWDTRASSEPVRCITPSTDTCGMITAISTINTSSTAVEGNDSTGAVGDDLNCENSLSIFAGYEDGSLHVFDIRNDKNSLCSAKLHEEPIFALDAFQSSRGVRVLSGGGDASVRRSALTSTTKHSNKAAELTQIDSITLPHPGTSCIRHRSDGRLVVSTHWDYTVRIFDQKRLKPLAILRQHRDSVYAVDFVPVGASSLADTASAGSREDTAASQSLLSESQHKEKWQQESSTNTTTASIDENIGTDNHNNSINNTRTNSGGNYQDDYEDSAAECTGNSPFSAAVFATASKDCTIALWNLYADSFKG